MRPEAWPSLPVPHMCTSVQAPTLKRREAAGRVQYSGLSELQAMMDLLRELNYEAAKRARMASRTATSGADSDDESECSSSAASVAGTVGSIDVHDSSDSSATEQAAEVQGIAQRLQHSEVQVTQVSVLGVNMVRTHGRATLLFAATDAMQVTRMVRTAFQHPNQPGLPALLLVEGLCSQQASAASTAAG